MQINPDDAIKLLLAISIGGLIGIEREVRDKAAGFRTIILICTGAALFTMFSLKLGGLEDPVRIAASLVTGVGFLGAGVILRDSGKVTGLTTAATIWLAAALGMGIGGGLFGITMMAASVVFVVLWLFPLLEGWVDNLSDRRTYEIVIGLDQEKYTYLNDLLKENNLKILASKRVKKENHIICTWVTNGKPKAHLNIMRDLIDDEDVISFDC